MGLAVLVVLLIGRRWLIVVGWVVALGGGGLLNVVLKAQFHRVRPMFTNPWLTETGWSFPNGFAGGLRDAGLPPHRRLALRFRWIVAALSAGLVLVIGFSRIYLGVHFFSDVVAGYAAATMWLSICISGCEVARPRPRIRQMPET